MSNNSIEIIDIPYEYEENIDRVWFWIRDIKLLNLINPDRISPIVITKGIDTWTEDNEFEGTLNNISKYKAKVLKNESLPFSKSAKWELYLIDMDQVVTQTISLFKVTENDSTVLLARLELFPSTHEKRMTNEQLMSHTNNIAEVFRIVEKILKESSINLFQYEGGVIKAPMKAIWDFVTDPNSITQIAKKITIVVESNGGLHVGGTIKVTHINDNSYYLATITKLDNRQGSNKWVIGLEVFEGKPKIPFQEISMNLTKINSNESHLSVFHEFREPATPEVIQLISTNKKLLLFALKEVMENINNIHLSK